MHFKNRNIACIMKNHKIMEQVENHIENEKHGGSRIKKIKKEL